MWCSGAQVLARPLTTPLDARPIRHSSYPIRLHDRYSPNTLVTSMSSKPNLLAALAEAVICKEINEIVVGAYKSLQVIEPWIEAEYCVQV